MYELKPILLFLGYPLVEITSETFTTKSKWPLLTKITPTIKALPWPCRNEPNTIKWSKLLLSIWRWILLTFSSSKRKAIVKHQAMLWGAPLMELSKICSSISDQRHPRRCSIKSWQYPFTSSKIRNRSSVLSYPQIRYEILPCFERKDTIENILHKYQFPWKLIFFSSLDFWTLQNMYIRYLIIYFYICTSMHKGFTFLFSTTSDELFQGPQGYVCGL